MLWLKLPPLWLVQVFVPGCRPAGDIMTVTQASGSVVLSLDDRPVHDAVRGRHMNDVAHTGNAGTPVMLLNVDHVLSTGCGLLSARGRV